MEEEVNSGAMERWVRVCRSWEEEAEADREFWMRFSPEERVGLVEPADPEHTRFLAFLSTRGIRALLCGVHAIAFYSKPRYCETLQVFVDVVAESVARHAADKSIEIVTTIPVVTFEEAWSQRVAGTFRGERVYFVSRQHLHRSRKASTELYASWDAELLSSFL